MAKAKKAAKAAAKVLVDVNDPRYILSQLEKEFESVPSNEVLNTALQQIADEEQKRKIDRVKEGFSKANQYIQKEVGNLRELRKLMRHSKERLVKMNDVRAKFLVDGDFDDMLNEMRALR